MQSSFSIGLLCSVQLFEQVSPYLGQPDANLGKLESAGEASTQRYRCEWFDSAEQLYQTLQARPAIDCLVLEVSLELPTLLERLQQQGLFFPSVILAGPDVDLDTGLVNPEAADLTDLTAKFGAFSYHGAVVVLPWAQKHQVGFAIDRAISQFIHLKPDPSQTAELLDSLGNLTTQQLRLADKLKERLDYLGVYYKRNPHEFLRHMSPPQREDLLRQLEIEYRDIVLAYFSEETKLNAMIDQFVNLAFFADVPIAQVVQIHMDLMDELSKQLKLEGRSEEVLLDYRLTLIDTLAHLCEMYRRSIPRES